MREAALAQRLEAAQGARCHCAATVVGAMRRIVVLQFAAAEEQELDLDAMARAQVVPDVEEKLLRAAGKGVMPDQDKAGVGAAATRP